VRNDYFRRLCETVLTLARQGSCIFVGRGIDRILPRGPGLRVRLLAPLSRRIEDYAREYGVTATESRGCLRRLQAERNRFILRHFGVEATDPSRHDLVINLERLRPRKAVELILAALSAAGVRATAGA
jgi:cytidylate kinase